MLYILNNETCTMLRSCCKPVPISISHFVLLKLGEGVFANPFLGGKSKTYPQEVLLIGDSHEINKFE